MSFFSTTPLFQASLASAAIHVSAVAVVSYVSCTTQTHFPSPSHVNQEAIQEVSLEFMLPPLNKGQKKEAHKKKAPLSKKGSRLKKEQRATKPASPSKTSSPTTQERVVDVSSLSTIDAYMPEPIYPKSALRQRKSGLVRLEFFLNKEGHVQKITRLISSGHPTLDQAAKKAVSQWRFPKKTAQHHRHLSAPIRFIL